MRLFDMMLGVINWLFRRRMETRCCRGTCIPNGTIGTSRERRAIGSMLQELGVLAMEWRPRKRGRAPFLGPGEKKGEEDGKPVGEGERMLLDDGIPNPLLEKNTE